MPNISPIYNITSHSGHPTFTLTSQSIPHLNLRLRTTSDIPSVTAILNNKANSQFDKSISTATPEELASIAERWTTVTKPLTYFNFLIFHNEFKEPLGIAGLGWIGPVHSNDDKDDHSENEPQGRAGAAGIILQPFAGGKGYGYEVLRMVFDYGLRELGLVEIRVGSYSGNVAMRGLMEGKFGFRPRDAGVNGEVDEFGNNLLWIVRREVWLGVNRNSK
ncbi:uncharacterized protein N7496_012282 [Penicillium cataractarum]|uniref:N-acetyltransferase domain-containing protein n=1 Tax=Penicillium cataractarum TaxID=2100454 RepID=A0A9W9R7F9_9EURO|nr:uncharacterized protein N7496_012282 [Penicillium cataractarum]KAJ5355070.1 hypothetical protein N7496_012282 [Penicillium cataractarum]